SAHELLPAVWVRQAGVGRLRMPSPLAAALERETPDGLAVPEALLRRTYDRNVARVQRLLDHGVDVLERFAAADIRAVPLKGLHSLLTGLWPDPAARTMADLDVLVPAEHALRAYDLLLDAGYVEHPEPIGEHADHHLPMLCDGDVTVELHVEPLVSRWRALVPAGQMLRRAMYRPTERGVLLLADDTDTFVHLVAHAQLQEETHALLGLPLRALFETALVQQSEIRWRDVRARFEAAGVAPVLDAHLHATRHWFGADELPTPSAGSARRARAHTRLVELGVAEPALVEAWTYLVRVPRSFTADRMRAEFAPADAADDHPDAAHPDADHPDAGPAWLWKARARHVVRRVEARLTRHEPPRAQ
ncbi:MAG TPA: nucleotidyltransferase family protein, partial [Acidimicrobiia bacterium]